MKIPYVIDNETNRLADVLNGILAEHGGRSLDIATAYFNVQGFRLLQPGLLQLGSFRLLLGDEPAEGASVGLRPRALAALRAALDAAPFTDELLRAVEDLIAFLRRPNVAVRAYQNGFLHAKAYLFYGDHSAAGWDRFQPVAAIVGSSNFTAAGLTSNRELNLAHKAVLPDEELEDDPSASSWLARPRPQQSFATLRRIRDEDGAVVEEQEQFAELVSNEFLQQQLRALLDAGGRQMLEELPDGIHSGLARASARGIFFYFTARARRGSGHEHFWRYYDLQDRRVLDNRFLIANLIACAPDTPRVVGDADVFAIQEKVIEHILAGAQEQRAIEQAPRVLDPIQQTVITVLRSYLNHPDVDRQVARRLIQALAKPLLGVHLRTLRAVYQEFARAKDVGSLFAALGSLPLAESVVAREDREPVPSLRRDDLHLVCFDFVWS